MDEKPKLSGHKGLTMFDQMHAMSKNPTLQTSPVHGAVENPRREFLKNRISARTEQSAAHLRDKIGWADGRMDPNDG